nr:MAG: hypothetical protein [Bacteriophage sp.]
MRLANKAISLKEREGTMNIKEYVYDNKLSSLSDTELRAYGRELLERQYAGEELTDKLYTELRDVCSEFVNRDN